MGKIKTNKAILYFWDMDKKDYRRIVFGDPKDLYPFFVKQSTVMNEILSEGSNIKAKNQVELQQALDVIAASRTGVNQTAALDENGYLEVSWDLHDGEKKKVEKKSLEEKQ